MHKLPYEKPTALIVELPKAFSLLATLSLEGDIAPLEEGGELIENEWDDFREN